MIKHFSFPKDLIYGLPSLRIFEAARNLVVLDNDTGKRFVLKGEDKGEFYEITKRTDPMHNYSELNGINNILVHKRVLNVYAQRALRLFSEQ